MSSILPGAIAGGVVAILVELAKRWIFVPRLTLICITDRIEFVPEARVPSVFSEEKGPEVGAKYLRVAVKNENWTKTPANNCRAYLTGLKKLDTDGSWKDTNYGMETLRLRWAYEGPNEALHGGINIPSGISVFFDVFSSQESVEWGRRRASEIRFLEFASRDARQAPEFVNLLELNSIYSFHINVSADEIHPVQAEIDVSIGDKWNEVRVIQSRTVTYE